MIEDYSLYEQNAILVEKVIEKYKQQELLADKMMEEMHFNCNIPFLFKNKSDDELEKIDNEINEYIANNLNTYLEMHNVIPKNADNIKIIYWFGMFVFERYNASFGISFLLEQIIDEIEESTNCKIDTLMIKKIKEIAEDEQESFFKYYGRFGLYHSLKHIYLTLKLTH